MDREQRERILRRWAGLKQERSSWIQHWQDISDFLFPGAGRYHLTDRNRGEPRNKNIHDNTGTVAQRVLAAGLMSGMTSPARPWFRLTTSDPTLDETEGVKRWLADTTRLMQMVFARSNTYRVLHSKYEELGAFGTSASILLPDYQDVIYGYPLTAGEYALAADHKGRINTLYREFQMTVAQLVGKFGYAACSNATRAAYDRGSLDQWVTVLHAIEPRAEYDLSRKNALNMPWASVYLEPGRNERTLRESGFKEFRALAARWTVKGRDIYGRGPGTEALGDVKQLQFEQVSKAKGLDYQTDPPLGVPTSLKHADVDTLPGGLTYVDDPSGRGAIKSLFDVQLDLNYLLADIQDIRERIRASFFTDLFLMLSSMPPDGRMTATEVMERHEEKMLMLGPVLERLHNELLNPLIETTFTAMIEASIVPPPPPELQGRNLQIEFMSVLAQAQQSVTTNSIDRFTLSLGTIAEMKPEVLDKFDSDHWADAYSDALGIDPDLVVASDKVALIRQQRAQQMAQQQQLEQAQQAAGVAKDLSSANTGDKNALTDTLSAFTGYG